VKALIVIACIAGTVFLVHERLDGWGWLVVIAILAMA